MSESYPELSDKDTHIKLVIGTEETLFNQTLDRGINHFDKLLSDLKGDTISGSDAFRLYDTYGFPLDLTQLIAREKGIAVDEDGFDKEAAKTIWKKGKFEIDRIDEIEKDVHHECPYPFPYLLQKFQIGRASCRERV